MSRTVWKMEGLRYSHSTPSYASEMRYTPHITRNTDVFVTKENGFDVRNLKQLAGEGRGACVLFIRELLLHKAVFSHDKPSYGRIREEESVWQALE